MEWDADRGHFLYGPNAHGEADQVELGRRVALELHYQPLLAEDPANFA
jgi:hypothetical protein